MTFALVLVVLALAFPWGAGALARRLARALPPREACWALTAAALLSAGGTVAALVGLFHVPFLASLEQVSPARVLRVWPAAVPVAAAAGLVLLAQGVLLVRRGLRQRALLRRAWASVADGTGDGDLLVVPGEEVDAYALPGYRGRAGRVVVTSGMVRALSAGQREVLLAHERAHLAGRHHLLSVLVDLSVVVHPALRPLRASLGFHLERWADEAAAEAVGDRRLTAAAITRAALAGAGAGAAGRGGYPVLAVSTGPVPQRVEALLGPVPTAPRGRARRVGAAGLAVGVAASAVLALGLAYGLHEYVEYAAIAVRGG
ncbi:M48 family metalloprotease [Streptomyces sp. NPDC001941]|uniref:M48 family metalloprotease n=1 Tax=Streptomyces sp. NPDC001941 TaxID=3154659 RepID=UPI0033177A62